MCGHQYHYDNGAFGWSDYDLYLNKLPHEQPNVGFLLEKEI
jgi:predicted N-acyltransferase